MAYSIVLFDADNTLLDFTRAEHDALCECLSTRRISTDADTVALYSAINDSHWKRLERGETTRTRLRVERFTEFFSAVGYSGDPVAMADDYVEALSRQSHLIDGALELCRALSAHCDLYIITNGFIKIQTGRFADSPITPFFKRIFISEEIGVEKPDVAFFDYVAREIPNFDKRTTLIVGDSLASDIEGGIRARIDTCWINPNEKPIPADKPITHVITALSELYQIIL